MSVTIEDLGDDRLHDASVVSARAFLTYPQWTALWPDGRWRRARVLYALYRAVLADALDHGIVEAAVDDGEVVGVAAWLPPGAYPAPVSRQIRQAPAAVKALIAFPGRARQAAQAAARIERAHPDEPPHWFLSTVAVDPGAQRTGLGRRLVRPHLATLDRHGQPCYLETADPRNVAWYERLGFAVCGEVATFDGGPTLWSMWRDPTSLTPA